MFRSIRRRLPGFTLAQQFNFVSLAILISGMVIIGWWVSRQISDGIINHHTATTALHVDSFVSPHLQMLGHGEPLSPDQIENLNELLRETSLARDIVSFKIWNTDGQIIYSTDPLITGQTFDGNEGLTRALRGRMASRLSDLRKKENVFERSSWDRLIETYSPVFDEGSARVIAVVEFYQSAKELQSEVGAAQTRSWVIVGSATAIMYLLLIGLVYRGSDTIARQQHQLHEKVSQLSDLLAQNQKLHRRVYRATNRVTALNEQYLRRISAELHDGPAQELGFVLLRFEDVIAACEACPLIDCEDSRTSETLNTFQDSLQRALRDIRTISAGLRLPELEHLNLEQILTRVVRIHEKRTGATVPVDYNQLPEQLPLPVKITIYRIIQEGLSNGFRHGDKANQRVQVTFCHGDLNVVVTDDGPGFDAGVAVDEELHLGIAGMRERVESLGGVFSLESRRGMGTKIVADLPHVSIGQVNEG